MGCCSILPVQTLNLIHLIEYIRFAEISYSVLSGLGDEYLCYFHHRAAPDADVFRPFRALTWIKFIFMLMLLDYFERVVNPGPAESATEAGNFI